jgi:hypothetical protein
MLARLAAIAALIAGILLSGQMPGPAGFPPGVFSNRGAIDASSSEAFAITYETYATTTTITGGIATFTSVAIGSADSTRVVVIGVLLKGSGSATAAVSAVALTVGATCTGSQATSAAQGNTGASSDIWYCAVASGTTATVAVTTTNSPTRASIVVYSVTGTSAAINPTSCCGGSAGGTGSVSATLTPPSGGGTIGFGWCSGDTTTATGSNLSLDLDDDTHFGANTVGAGHDTSSSGSTLYKITWGSNCTNAGSFATFSP